MNAISLTVNARKISAEVEPRLHLADFLREHLHLTGTHLGCEHGVCGACTLLVDGAPARGCITFAAACGGRDVVSIEGLGDDIVMSALRTAFSAAHALQCGYCTPGMLVTARDIVRRLPEADDDRIRLELAGNLCRCTGYNGIVKAIRQVLDLRLNLEPAIKPPLPASDMPDLAAAPAAAEPVPKMAAPDGKQIMQKLRIGVSPDTLWQALQDPALVASCVPGALLTSVEGDHIAGEMAVSFGPIQGKFLGSANVTYGDRNGSVHGEGQDKVSRTRLSAEAKFSVESDGENAVLLLTVTYSLRGALAQFARGPVVQAFADEIAGTVGRNLQAKLTGGVVTAPPKMNAFALAWRVLKARIGQLVSGGRRDG